LADLLVERNVVFVQAYGRLGARESAPFLRLGLPVLGAAFLRGFRRFGDIVVATIEDGHGDVRMLQEKIDQRFGFGLGDLMRPRPGFVVFVVVGEIAIEVDAADTVFVPEFIAVVVHALDEQRVDRVFALAAVGFLEQARFFRIRQEDSLKVSDAPAAHVDAHHADLTVAVEVFGAVFIHLTVAIVVDRPQGLSLLVLWGGEEGLDGVGVDARQNVHRMIA